MEHEGSIQTLDCLLPSQVKTVVVTHHAPSFRSCSTKYNPQLDSCYASDLDDRVKVWKPALWVHSHIHESRDYMIGETRVVSNPRGYDVVGDRSMLNPGFKPDFVVEV